jgi:23S rRNA (adenine2503-C2)-methyltransferase
MLRPHLRDLAIHDMAAALAAGGVRRADYWAQALSVRMHRHGAFTWEDLALGRTMGAVLRRGFTFEPLLEPVGARTAEDGTRKDLFRLRSGEQIETVLLHNIKNSTLCISSQAGCALACAFCATGRLGLQRNLSAGEITESIVRVQQMSGHRIHDIVFMGQGEPLHNYDAVMTASANAHHQFGLLMSKKRITISTVGLTPQIRRFTAEAQPWRLHLSLHSAIQETREKIMPVAKVHPLPALLDAMRAYQATSGRPWVTLQYIALPELNMDDAHVEALRTELAGLRYILNVIPYNDVDAGLRPPTWAEVKDFTTRLRSLHCPVKIRYSGGKQEGMGCGQLSAEQIACGAPTGHLRAPAGIFTA